MTSRANTEPVSSREATQAVLDSSTEQSTIRYRLSGQSKFSNLGTSDEGEPLRDSLRTSLQLEHLVMLFGSGTSTECGGPSMPELWAAAQKHDDFAKTREIVAYKGDNIEEFLSRCDAFLELNATDPTVLGSRDATIEMILTRCRGAGANKSDLMPHQELLKKVARRRARDSRVKLFTTNYDLCFERAAAELGLVPMDGFSFANPRHFDPRFFDYDIVRRSPSSEAASFVPGVFQYFKLHGSVDWSNTNSRIEVDANVPAASACLIYPGRKKFQRSYEQPHLELMARYLAALREPNTCLLVAGFSFGDEHLSSPILSALRTNPHFRLVVVSRTIDSKLEQAAPGTPWVELNQLATRADISFVASSFTNFVGLIPDLAALSPAHELESAVLRMTGKNP